MGKQTLQLRMGNHTVSCGMILDSGKETCHLDNLAARLAFSVNIHVLQTSFTLVTRCTSLAVAQIPLILLFLIQGQMKDAGSVGGLTKKRSK